MSEPPLIPPEPSKIQVDDKIKNDIRLALLREDLADMRHAQQLFQSTVSTYILIYVAIIAGRPSIKAFAPQTSPIYGYLLSIPIILTAFAVRYAWTADLAKDSSKKRKDFFTEIVGRIEPKEIKGKDIIARTIRYSVNFYGKSTSSRGAFIVMMVIADCFCFYYLSRT